MRGWGCDCLKDGFLLMIVRPVTQADVPEDVIIPPMAQHRRLFPSQRVQAEINILVEPLSKSTVRFAYSLTIPLAPKVPLWCAAATALREASAWLVHSATWLSSNGLARPLRVAGLSTLSCSREWPASSPR